MSDDGELVPLVTADLEERAYRAYQLKLTGMEAPEIARKLGFESGAQAERAIANLIRKAAEQAAEERRDEVLGLELARLDALQNAVWGMAIGGDLKAVDSVLKIMAHRKTLLRLAEESESGTFNTVIVSGDEYAETLKGLVSK